ncbi:MAG: tetratricopeptide repeat protein [Bacteroidales bacterium]|nr:tetratricopeptide repeat protein [Bacteroidales bacterium]
MSSKKPQRYKHHHQEQTNLYNEQSRPKYLIWIPFIFAFVLYGNSITNDFALDDLPQIVNHRMVLQGWGGIGELLTTNYWSASDQNLGYYRPLAHVSFAIENAIHGNNPHIMHLINVLLYALTGMALFVFLSKLFRRMPFFVLVATLLFLAHPVHTEVVANIKSRDEILSFLNSTMALLLAYNFAKNKYFPTLVLALIFYFLALMSKETAMTTLAVVPFMLYFFTPKNGGKIASITLSFVIVSALFLALKYYMIGTLSGDPPNEMNVYPYKEFSGRIPTMLYIFGMYLWRLVMPVRLLYDYSYNQIPEASWANPVVWLALIILFALAFFALKGLKKKDIFSFAILYFGISLSVGLAFIITRGGIMAERFLYAPVLGFSLALSYLLFKLLPREIKTNRIVYDFKPLPSRVFVGILLAIMLFYTGRTIARNPVWKDNFTLFSTDVVYGGKSALLRKHYGSELINQAVAATDQAEKDSLMKTGIAEVEKAIEINPRFSEAYFKLGYAYYQMRDYDTSIGYYKKTNQNNSLNLSNMALAYYMKGEHGEALRLLQRSLQLNPYNATARTNLPLVQNAFNNKLQSMKNQKSSDPKHYFDLGNLFMDTQNYEEALFQFEKAVKLSPEFVDALLKSGDCYYALKKYDGAIRPFKKVLEIDQHNKEAAGKLSHLYGLLGNTEMQQYYSNKSSGK